MLRIEGKSISIPLREHKIARVKGTKTWKRFVFMPEFNAWVQRGRSKTLYTRNAIEILHELN